MASWMVHFRIADIIMDELTELNSKSYLVGNIGPDCGEANEDWSVFTPSSEITHWAPGGKKEKCDYNLFYELIVYPQMNVVNELRKLNKYQCNCKSHCGTDQSNSYESGNQQNFKDDFSKENDRLSFYIGYYIHLLTDVLWVKKIANRIHEKWSDKFQEDPNFIWEVKNDWYDLDHLFLKKNPNFRSFQLFREIQSLNNIYLDYYSNDAFTKQISYITGFYSEEHNNLVREYTYLAEDEMDNFVQEATKRIIEDLKDKDIIKE